MAKRRKSTPRRDAPATRGLMAEGAAVLVMASALLLLLSLATHSVSDPVPWPFGGGRGEEVSNVAGIAGSWLSEALFQTFGWAAWTAPLLLFLVGWRLFFRRPSRLLAGGFG